MDPESTNITASLLWQATEDFDVEFQVDYLDDSRRLLGYTSGPAKFGH